MSHLPGLIVCAYVVLLALALLGSLVAGERRAARRPAQPDPTTTSQPNTGSTE